MGESVSAFIRESFSLCKTVKRLQLDIIQVARLAAIRAQIITVLIRAQRHKELSCSHLKFGRKWEETKTREIPPSFLLPLALYIYCGEWGGAGCVKGSDRQVKREKVGEKPLWVKWWGGECPNSSRGPCCCYDDGNTAPYVRWRRPRR